MPVDFAPVLEHTRMGKVCIFFVSVCVCVWCGSCTPVILCIVIGVME